MISLEAACLNVIVEEFERFHTAFSLSRDQTLNHNFEFLQRIFTAELISELSKKNELKKEYLDFLLNVHLKSLNENWFINSRYGISLEDIICRLPRLTTLSLPFQCTDEILKRVAKFCPFVVEIDACYSSVVTDTGFKYLCKNENGKISCPELKELFISYTSVTDEGLLYLIQNIPSLEVIHHNNVPQILYSFHKQDYRNHVKIPTYNLVRLKLFTSDELPYYSELLKICLTVCPKLKELTCKITTKEQLNILSSTKLEMLNLLVYREKRGLRRKIDISSLLKNNGCNLMSLNTYNCRISINVLAANCPKLDDIVIEDGDLFYESEYSQLNFYYLTNCTLKGTTVDTINSKAVYILLSSSSNLENLEFQFCAISAEMETYILECCGKTFLKYISFLCTRVKMRLVKGIILSFPFLKTLKLVRCGYTLDKRRELTEFVQVLTNKPYIYVDEICINEYDYENDIAYY